MRALLDGLGVRIFAEVDTPSGGKHFCVADHPELPSVHSTEKNQRLPGYPGVDIKSHGCNVFTPGTLRIKYGGLGYDVVFDELDRLPRLDDDEEGTVEFVDWVARRDAVRTGSRRSLYRAILPRWFHGGLCCAGSLTSVEPRRCVAGHVVALSFPPTLPAARALCADCGGIRRRSANGRRVRHVPRAASRSGACGGLRCADL